MYTGLSEILGHGNLGVDAFLFLSAVGLSRSFKNNSLGVFYWHRLRRVVIPYLVLALPFFAWYDFVVLNDGIGQYVLNVSTANYWLTGQHPTWYIAFIIIAYLLFPFLYRMDAKTKHVSSILIIVISVIGEYFMMKKGMELYVHAERALSRIPVFLLGISVSDYVYSKAKITWIQCWAWFIAGVALFGVVCFAGIHIVLVRYLYGLVGVSIIVCYSRIRSIGALPIVSRLFAWLGVFSLELYVTHVLLIRIINVEGGWHLFHWWVWYLLVPVTSVCFALLLQKFTNLFGKRYV